MSLLKRNSPEKSKSKKEKIEPQTGVQSSSPENKKQPKAKPEIKENLISRYKFNADEIEYQQKPLEEVKKEPLEQVFALPEQETIAPVEQMDQEVYFDLLDLTFKCDIYLKIKLTQPTSIQAQRLEDIERQIIHEKIEVFTKDFKIIELGHFKDRLYYIEDIPVIPETLFKVSGFLREFFDITHVYIIRLTGKLELKETVFCDYWSEEKLNSFMDIDLMEHMVNLNGDPCLRCPYNILNKRV